VRELLGRFAGRATARVRLNHAARTSLWPVAAGFAVVVFVVVLANSTGGWVGDNRYEQYDNPARRVARLLTLWDASRGLGRIREDLWPGVTLPLALLRGLGASNALAEHLWHATLIVLGGVGMVAVLRLFRPRLGLEHVLAGLVYMLGPYSAVFLTPSNLYSYYAIAPWLVVCTYRGVHSGRPWPWAARFGLIIFLAGNNDLPGLVYACLTLVSVLAFSVFVARTTTIRAVAAWLARAAMAAVAVNAGALYKVWAAAATYAQRLGVTESPEVIARTSSWSESLRGLGNWLSYFPSPLGLVRPQAEPFLTQPWVVAASFVAPLLAVGTVCLSRWRPRLLFATMMLTSLVLMVGAHPLDDPSPYGELLLEAYERSSFLDVFRNSYKAGSGLMMGTAALFGVGAVEALGWLRRHRPPPVHNLAAAGLALALVGAAVPFWSLDLYKQEWRVEQIPAYVGDAMAWMDDQDGGGRVLVAPGAWRNGFRWGWVNDDVLDAMLRRPHVIETAIPLSNPMAADLLRAVDASLDDRHYSTGSIGPLARRLGVDHLMIRNDIDWQRSGVARPADYSRLRTDPDLELAATFGAPGQFTTAAQDRSTVAAAERELPPVEIYRVRDGAPVVRAEVTRPALLVSGGGGAFVSLAAAGLLDDAGPVRYTAATPTGRTTELLAQGAGVVVTDTNRRRLTIVTGETEESHTLAAGRDLSRPAQDLFDLDGSQTVATFGDGASIGGTGTFNPIGGFTPWYRPAKAFDGDPRTAWLTAAGRDPTGDRLRVDFRDSVELKAATLEAALPTDVGSTITEASLAFSDGSRLPVALTDGRARVAFPARTVDWVEIVIEGRAGSDGPPVGFREITFPDLDLVEVVQAPDDLFRAADQDDRLAALVGGAPLSYLFSRSTSEGLVDEELVLRRRFRALAERRYELSGAVRVGVSTPDRVLDELAGGPIGAWGSSRYQGTLASWGGAALDGDPTTRWSAPAVPGERLNLRFGPRAVGVVEVVTGAGGDLSSIEAVRVTADGLAVDAPVVDGVARAELPLGLTRELVVEITEIRARAGGGGMSYPVAVDGIRLDGRALRSEAPFSSAGCTEGVLSLDGDDVPVRLVGASATRVVSGEAVRIEACRPIRLGDGWHELVAAPAVLADRVVLASPSPSGAVPPSTGAAPAIELLDQDPGRVHLRLDAPDGAVLVGGQSWDAGWRASVNGEDVGGAEPIDTLNGWELGAGSDVDVVLEFRPQETFEVTLLLSLAALAGCAWVGRPARRCPLDGPLPPPLRSSTTGPGPVLRRRWRHRPRARGRGPGPRRASDAPSPTTGTASAGVPTAVAMSAAMVLTGFVVFGVPGAMVSLAAAATTTQRSDDPGRALAAAALVLFALAAAYTVVKAGPVSIRYAEDRSLAGALAAAGAIALGCALVSAMVRERAPARSRGARAPAAAPAPAPGTAHRRPALVTIAAFIAGPLAVAAVVGLGANEPVPAACRDLVDNVADGTGYALGSGRGARPSAACAPAGPFVAAFWPLGAGFALALTAAGTVSVVVALARRGGDWRAGAGGTALVVALAPWWAQDLPSALAAFGLSVAVVMARPRALDARRAAMAGGAVALAALSRPEALVTLPLLALWGLARGGRRSGAGAGRAGVLLGTAALGVLPWAIWARDNVGSWWPGGVGGATLRWAVPAAVALGATATSRWVNQGRRASPGPPGSVRAALEPRRATGSVREQ